MIKNQCRIKRGNDSTERKLILSTEKTRFEFFLSAELSSSERFGRSLGQ
jgi:hypothetical protein